jgi:hypothetical protein
LILGRFHADVLPDSQAPFGLGAFFDALQIQEYTQSSLEEQQPHTTQPNTTTMEAEHPML